VRWRRRDPLREHHGRADAHNSRRRFGRHRRDHAAHEHDDHVHHGQLHLFIRRRIPVVRRIERLDR
jgi:hypothetical protein